MRNVNVCILDYGSGNLLSVYNLFSSICSQVFVSNNENDIKNASHVVLPGVGAFGAAMAKVKKNLPLKFLEERIIVDKIPYLGICVGMQILATTGTEFGQHEGLNWVPGTVMEHDAHSYPLPHVGWNEVSSKCPKNTLLNGLDKHNDFYFVHKFAFVADNPNHVVATTQYGNEFCSIIQKDNIYGVQFHPEKSQQAGRKLALNFLALA